MILDLKQIDKVVLNALEEDMPYGDVTTDNLISPEDCSKARFIAKAEMSRGDKYMVGKRMHEALEQLRRSNK